MEAKIIPLENATICIMNLSLPGFPFPAVWEIFHFLLCQIHDYFQFFFTEMPCPCLNLFSHFMTILLLRDDVSHTGWGPSVAPYSEQLSFHKVHINPDNIQKLLQGPCTIFILAYVLVRVQTQTSTIT